MIIVQENMLGVLFAHIPEFGGGHQQYGLKDAEYRRTCDFVGQDHLRQFAEIEFLRNFFKLGVEAFGQGEFVVAVKMLPPEAGQAGDQPEG